MKERGEERKRKEGKRKGERNRRVIVDISLDLRQSDDQNSSEKETKFIYAMRASYRYQDPEFLSNSKRYGFSPTLVSPCLRAIQWP